MSYDEKSEALSIFSKYISDTRYFAVHNENGKTYAGPDPALVKMKDLARLGELGWYEDNESSCFYIFSA